MGRFTHKTSSRVDNPTPTNRTNMIDKFQVQHLRREKKPAKNRKRHKCPVCHEEGHHAKTCLDVLLASNEECAKAFLVKLVERGTVNGYLKSATNRFGMEFARSVMKRLDELAPDWKEPREKNVRLKRIVL